MTTVLVTGATGLIGSRVVTALRGRGITVVPTSRSGGRGSVGADLMSAESTRCLVDQVRPDATVHLAGGRGGVAGPYAVNVVPTVHLLDALIATAPASRIISVGSAAEYGEGTGVPISETDVCSPVNEYGRAKLAQTEVALTMAREHGLDLLVVRPFNVVAPDLPTTTPLGNICNQLRSGEGPTRVVRCGRTDVVRDFVTVDGVADVLADLVLRGAHQPLLNLCSGEGSTLGDLIAGIARALRVEPVIEADPALVALPAGDRVVGDATALRRLGHELDGSLDAVVSSLVPSIPWPFAGDEH